MEVMQKTLRILEFPILPFFCLCVCVFKGAALLLRNLLCLGLNKNVLEFQRHGRSHGRSRHLAHARLNREAKLCHLGLCAGTALSV